MHLVPLDIRSHSKPLFSSIMPPSIAVVKIYFEQKGASEKEAEHFFLFYEKKGWMNKKEKPYQSWKPLAYAWISSALAREPALFNKNIH